MPKNNNQESSTSNQFNDSDIKAGKDIHIGDKHITNNIYPEKSEQKGITLKKKITISLIGTFMAITLFNIKECNLLTYSPTTVFVDPKTPNSDSINTDTIITINPSAKEPTLSPKKKNISQPKARQRKTREKACFAILDKANNKLPISNATITIRELGFDNQTTNENGVACFMNLPLKKVKVIVRKDPDFRTYEDEVNIMTEQAENTFEILLEKSVNTNLTFYGTIENETGILISAIPIYLKFGTISKTVVTDETGNYIFEVADEAAFSSFTIRVNQSLYEPVKIKGDLGRKDGNSLENNIVLKKISAKNNPTNSDEKKKLTYPVIIIVQDEKEQSMTNKVDVLINGQKEGKAGKTFYVPSGRNTINLKWKDKTFEEVIEVKKGKLIPKILISIEDFS